jgi:dipeptidyl aminopeptidase/acylaminoacyl peptidase
MGSPPTGTQEPMRAIFALCLLLAVLPRALAQQGYRLPPPEVADLLTAPPSPAASLSPDGAWMLLLQHEAMPSIADVSRRMLRLGGLRVDPVARARFSTRFAVSAGLRSVGDPAAPVHGLALPTGSRIAGVSWSPDSAHFTVQVLTAKGSELWGGDVSGEGNLRRLVEDLNTVLVRPSWIAGGKRVLCARAPADQGPEPPAPQVPTGPNVQQTSGSDTPLRTYQDLLANSHDEDLLDHHLNAELILVDVDSGEVQALATDRFAGASASPDGSWVLETVLRRPYSYMMPVWRFPRELRLRPVAGGEPKQLARLPLVEEVPIGGVSTQPRSHTWNGALPATLLWALALDGGDPNREAPHRDRWMSLDAPFEDTGAARELLRVEGRAQGLAFLDDPRYLITSEYDRDRRWTRSLLHDLSEGGLPAVLEDRSVRDRYGDPGRLLTHPGPFGSPVVRVDAGHVYRAGRGASPQGERPFLASQDLDGKNRVELWRSAEGSYESLARLLPGSPLAFLAWHETPTTPPNLRRHQVGQEPVVALTNFADPTPAIRGISKRLVFYERADGVPLSATLYLPADYEPGARLPLFVWAYPREFNDRATAGQVSGSQDRFTRIAGSSHLVLLTQGWAVMDGATMPIIGDPRTMNDTFLEQLVSSAQAAVDFAVAEGVGDPERTAVGGHSYGAFMTANLLAHSDIFKAGVARSGAYNRTLTPFGFQSERRTLWQAPETYFKVSPFMHADKINEPLLLVHGEADNNSGTFPMQSQRLFHAIQGHGGTARLVMLPAESHGYRARESVLHMQAETIEWLERFVAVDH